MASSSNSHDYYADLHIPPTATQAVIKSAFFSLAKQHHPDKSGVSDAIDFRRAREAYEILSSPSRRAIYDASCIPAPFVSSPRYPQAPGTPATSPFAAREAREREEEPELSRTAQYEAFEAEERARTAPRPLSPRPARPRQKPGEPGWKYFLGKEYLAWQKRDEAWARRHPEEFAEQFAPSSRTSTPRTTPPVTDQPTAHFLPLCHRSHPAATSTSVPCSLPSRLWTTQPSSPETCTFCLRRKSEGRRCPACEVSACGGCFARVVWKEQERERKGDFGRKTEGREEGERKGKGRREEGKRQVFPSGG